MPTEVKFIRRYVVWPLGVCVFLAACLAALISSNILPPAEVMAYQYGFTNAPTLGKATVHLRGWGWYPIRNEEGTSNRPPQVTFVQFAASRDPATRPVTLFYKDESISNEFVLSEKQYSWGTAKIIDPRFHSTRESHFAWLPDHRLFVAAADDDDLQAALSILEISKRD